MSNLNADPYSGNDLHRDVIYIKSKLQRIDGVMFGTKESAIPEGIIFEVNKNTEFRRTITKWFWIVGTQLTIIILFLIYNTFNGSF